MAALSMLFLLLAPFAAPGAAQQPLDSVIGNDESGAAIVITRVEPRVIGTLAKAAGVPMGLETAGIARPSAPSCPKWAASTGPPAT